MDGISAAASIAGIASVGVQLSIKLITLASQVSNASRTIGTIADDVALTSGVLQQLKELMLQKASDDGISIFNEWGLETTKRSANKCEKIFQDIEKETRKASAQIRNSHAGNPTGFVTLSRFERAKWPFLQPSMEVLRGDLREAKGTLLLILQVTTLAFSRRLVELNKPALSSQEEQQDIVRALVVSQIQLHEPEGTAQDIELLLEDSKEDKTFHGSDTDLSPRPSTETKDLAGQGKTKRSKGTQHPRDPPSNVGNTMPSPYINNIRLPFTPGTTTPETSAEYAGASRGGMELKTSKDPSDYGLHDRSIQNRTPRNKPLRRSPPILPITRRGSTSAKIWSTLKGLASPPQPIAPIASISPGCQQEFHSFLIITDTSMGSFLISWDPVNTRRKREEQRDVSGDTTSICSQEEQAMIKTTLRNCGPEPLLVSIERVRTNLKCTGVDFKGYSGVQFEITSTTLQAPTKPARRLERTRRSSRVDGLIEYGSPPLVGTRSEGYRRRSPVRILDTSEFEGRREHRHETARRREGDIGGEDLEVERRRKELEELHMKLHKEREERRRKEEQELLRTEQRHQESQALRVVHRRRKEFHREEYRRPELEYERSHMPLEGEPGLAGPPERAPVHPHFARRMSADSQISAREPAIAYRNHERRPYKARASPSFNPFPPLGLLRNLNLSHRPQSVSSDKHSTAPLNEQNVPPTVHFQPGTYVQPSYSYADESSFSSPWVTEDPTLMPPPHAASPGDRQFRRDRIRRSGAVIIPSLGEAPLLLSGAAAPSPSETDVVNELLKRYTTLFDA